MRTLLAKTFKARDLPNIVLFTTCDLRSGRNTELRRLIDSVEAFRLRRPGARAWMHLLLQNCPNADEDEFIKNFPDWVRVMAVPGRIPLSEARNRMIDEVSNAGLLAADALVAFPDDDAWYPDYTLEHLHDLFASDQDLEFWFCKYSSRPLFQSEVSARTPTVQEVISHASSNTIATRGRVLHAIGGFDEALGLGTKANGGEDTEFALRAFYAAQKTLFVSAEQIGHRDPDPALRGKYFAGALAGILRHADVSMAGRVTLVRKLIVGLALVVKRQMSVAALRKAVALASLIASRAGKSHRPGDLHGANRL